MSGFCSRWFFFSKAPQNEEDYIHHAGSTWSLCFPGDYVYLLHFLWHHLMGQRAWSSHLHKLYLTSDWGVNTEALLVTFVHSVPQWSERNNYNHFRAIKKQLCSKSKTGPNYALGKAASEGYLQLLWSQSNRSLLLSRLH